ncbi:MAG: hypothetical protein AAGI23_16840 [Bacteroidota bacterium]
MKLIQLSLLLMVLCFTSCEKENLNKDVLITPGVGLGEITFSSTGSDVISKYGTYERLTVVRSLSNTSFVMWYDNGLGFQLEHFEIEDLSLREISDQKEELIDVSQKVIQIVVMPPFEAVTTEGIRLGSPKADVIAAYGESSTTFGGELYEDLGLNIWYNSSDEVNRIDVTP